MSQPTTYVYVGDILTPVSLEKTPGDFTPASHDSRTSSMMDNMEKGPMQMDGPQPITHRPTGFKWFLVMFSFLIGLFLFALDNTVVADIQPAIVKEFDSVDKLPWLATAFFLSATALMLPFGQFCTIFNAKWFYIANVVIFEAGSALCGAAQSMNALIIGRMIAGIGATGIYTGSIFLISVNTSVEERPTYIGMTGAMWGLGTVLGPVVGGSFTDSSAGWRWAFYINLPIGALMAPVLLFLIPSFDAQKGTPYIVRLARVDWIGIILLIGSIVSFVLGISWGGNQYDWNSPQVIGTFATAGASTLLFAFSQTLYMPGQTPERRIFPVFLLFNRTTVLLYILTATSSTVALVTIFYLPLFFQFTKGDSALSAAVRLLPVVFTLVFAVVAGGLTVTKIGFYSPFYIAGTALALIGSALLHTVDMDTKVASIYGFSILVGLGAGLYIQLGFSVAQAKVLPEQIGAVTGFISLGQLLGPVISLSIAGTVLVNTATSGLQELFPDVSKEVLKRAIAGTAGELLSSLDDMTRRMALEVIVNSMSKVYLLTITAGAVGFVASLLLKHERLLLQAGAAG